MDTVVYNYILVWVCIIGLCFGSFYNVVILRSLNDESIVFPPSKCPKCNNKLKPWHNIPVLSYIFLKGKCAFCKEKISVQYPIIEILTSILFAFCFIKFGLEWKTLFAIILSSCLLIMSMTDIKEKLVDCNIAIGLAIIGLIYNWLFLDNILNSLYGLLAGILIIESIAFLGYLFVKKRALGEADTYVAGALGACFGLQGVLTILLYTLITASIFIIPMFLYQQFKKGQKTLCIIFILFILTALAYQNLVQNWYTFSLLFILGLLLIFKVLKNLRSGQSPLYLPLVPAFSLAALYFLFF